MSECDRLRLIYFSYQHSLQSLRPGTCTVLASASVIPRRLERVKNTVRGASLKWKRMACLACIFTRTTLDSRDNHRLLHDMTYSCVTLVTLFLGVCVSPPYP